MVVVRRRSFVGLLQQHVSYDSNVNTLSRVSEQGTYTFECRVQLMGKSRDGPDGRPYLFWAY